MVISRNTSASRSKRMKKMTPSRERWPNRLTNGYEYPPLTLAPPAHDIKPAKLRIHAALEIE